MKDLYKNFNELKHAEAWGSFTITSKKRGSDFLIFSPHAGGIEQGTSEICKQIAGKTYSYYLFNGTGSNCKRLHITSTNFDEPKLLKLLSKHTYAISIHGMTNAMERIIGADIYLGGMNRNLIEITTKILRENNFNSTNNIEKPESPLSGINPENVTNKCVSGQGMQIEISENVRAGFFVWNFKYKRNREMERTESFYNFCNAIRESILFIRETTK